MYVCTMYARAHYEKLIERNNQNAVQVIIAPHTYRMIESLAPIQHEQRQPVNSYPSLLLSPPITKALKKQTAPGKTDVFVSSSKPDMNARSSRHLASVVSPLLSTSFASTYSSNPYSQNPSTRTITAQYVHGNILERCVGNLAQVCATDNVFDADMKLKPLYVHQSTFGWQPDVSKSAQGESQLSLLTKSLCKAVCEQFIRDLRDPNTILEHFLHLARAVEFVHSRGVVHNDLKSENIFVRATRCSGSNVSVQLVIADFDRAVTFPLKDSHSQDELVCDVPIVKVEGSEGRGEEKEVVEQQTNVDWSCEIPSKCSGSFGFSPNIFHSMITFGDLIRDIDNEASASDNKSLSLSLQVREQMYENRYLHKHCFVSRACDVFALGMIFLSMLERGNLFSFAKGIWVKKEMEYNRKCGLEKKDGRGNNQGCSLGLNCTPAHVLLFHQYRNVMPDERLRCSSYYHGYDVNEQSATMNPSSEVVFKYSELRKRHNSVLDRVKSGSIHENVCFLLHEMTAEDPAIRPSISHCISVLESVLIQ